MSPVFFIILYYVHDFIIIVIIDNNILLNTEFLPVLVKAVGKLKYISMYSVYYLSAAEYKY